MWLRRKRHTWRGRPLINHLPTGNAWLDWKRRSRRYGGKSEKSRISWSDFGGSLNDLIAETPMDPSAFQFFLRQLGASAVKKATASDKSVRPIPAKAPSPARSLPRLMQR